MREESTLAKTVEHWGQRKLLLSEIEFYAGAAPGTHIDLLAWSLKFCSPSWGLSSSTLQPSKHVRAMASRFAMKPSTMKWHTTFVEKKSCLYRIFVAIHGMDIDIHHWRIRFHRIWCSKEDGAKSWSHMQVCLNSVYDILGWGDHSSCMGRSNDDWNAIGGAEIFNRRCESVWSPNVLWGNVLSQHSPPDHVPWALCGGRRDRSLLWLCSRGVHSSKLYPQEWCVQRWERTVGTRWRSFESRHWIHIQHREVPLLGESWCSRDGSSSFHPFVCLCLCHHAHTHMHTHIHTHICTPGALIKVRVHSSACLESFLQPFPPLFPVSQRRFHNSHCNSIIPSTLFFAKKQKSFEGPPRSSKEL